jgi:hypothetical protein
MVYVVQVWKGAKLWMTPPEMWSLDEFYVRCGWIAEKKMMNRSLGWNYNRGRPSYCLPIFKCPPLLHCDTAIGNVIFEFLRDMINERIETYAFGEELI